MRSHLQYIIALLGHGEHVLTRAHTSLDGNSDRLWYTTDGRTDEIGRAEKHRCTDRSRPPNAKAIDQGEDSDRGGRRVLAFQFGNVSAAGRPPLNLFLAKHVYHSEREWSLTHNFDHVDEGQSDETMAFLRSRSLFSSSTSIKSEIWRSMCLAPEWTTWGVSNRIGFLVRFEDKNDFSFWFHCLMALKLGQGVWSFH